MTPDTTRHATIEPPKDGETPLHNIRWEAFCIAYTGPNRRNGAAAYVAAGYKPKAPQTAAANAERLLRNADIQNRIGHLNTEALKIERLHARDAVKRLATIAMATLADFMDAEGRIDPAKVADPTLSAAVQEMTIDETPAGRRIKIKLKDDMRALELLGLTEGNADASAGQTCLIIEV